MIRWANDKEKSLMEETYPFSFLAAILNIIAGLVVKSIWALVSVSLLTVHEELAPQ